jgi:hypothetical protein
MRLKEVLVEVGNLPPIGSLSKKCCVIAGLVYMRQNQEVGYFCKDGATETRI